MQVDVAAPWRQGPLSPTAARASGEPVVLVALWSASLFLPLAPVPGVGSSVQIGQLFSLLLTGYGLLRWKRVHPLPLLLYGAVVGSVVASLLVVAVSPGTVPALGTAAFYGLALSPVLAAAAWGPRLWNPGLLIGVSCAFVGHAAMGLVQQVGFARGYFPLQQLFVSDVFALPTANPQLYVRFVARPFGWFPESSAMAASVGPWIVLFVALLLARTHVAGVWTRRGRVAVSLSVAASMWLVFVSQSAYVVALGASLSLLGVAAGSSFGGGQRRTRLLYLAVIVAAIVVVAWPVLNDRVARELAYGSSWNTRLRSVTSAWELWLSSPSHFLFGVGPGESAGALRDLRSLQSAGGPRPEAIFSATFQFVSETGVLGLGALTAAVVTATRQLRRRVTPPATWLIAVNTAIALTVVTSYVNLAPIWGLVGLLLVPPSTQPSDPSNA